MNHNLQEPLEAAKQKAEESQLRSAENTYAGQRQMTAAMGIGRLHTPAEEAAKAVRHHAEAHAKHSAALDFLSRHPEFDEFVRLVRAGSIQL